MQEEAKWYVVHTYSGYENKVASTLETTVKNHNLQDLIQRVCVPTEIVVEEKRNKNNEVERKEVERKIFPGYVIIKMVMTGESWYVVRNIRGCTGFVGPSSKPVPLTEEEVARLGVELQPEGNESPAETEAVKKPVEVSFAPGDTVIMRSGALEGYTGKVDEINIEKGTVVLKVNFFGKDTRTEIAIEDVELDYDE